MRIEDPDKAQTRANLRKPKQNEDGTWRYVLSTEAMDSYSTRFLVKGWNLKRFLSNPVVPWAHQTSMPPVGKAERIWKSVEGKGPALLMDVRFMQPADYANDWPAGFPSPVAIEAMTAAGYIRGSSVHFNPIKWDYIREDGANGKPDKNGAVIGIEYQQQELNEGSIVPLPSNADSLVRCLTMGFMTLAHLPEVYRMMEVAEDVDPEVMGCLRREMDSPKLFALGGIPDLRPEPPACSLNETTQDLLDEVRNVGGLARTIAGPPGSPVDGAELAEPLAKERKLLSTALRQRTGATGEPHDQARASGTRQEGGSRG